MGSRKGDLVPIYHERWGKGGEREQKKHVGKEGALRNPACIPPPRQESMAAVLHIQQHIQVKHTLSSNKYTVIKKIAS